MTEKKYEDDCPVGHQDCNILAEVSELQRRTTELEAQVQTDALTGLCNFRGFVERLDQ